MSLEIKNSVHIYIVPFYFDKDYYEKLVSFFKNDMINSTNKWMQYNLWSDDNIENQVEMDIYSFFKSSMCESDCRMAKNLGISFKMNDKNCLKRIICDLSKNNEENKKTFEADITDLGLFIFNEGITFLWYEIKTAANNKLNSDDLILFQNMVKELSRSKYAYYIENGKKYPIGKWIVEILKDQKSIINYFAEREINIDGSKIIVPDKALLFNYLFTNQAEKNTRELLAYRITNGFDEKYCPPDNIEKYMYEPYGNATAYVTKSGMSYIINDSEKTNSYFFLNHFDKKFKNDYFFIYIILLYQSYSCFYYSNKLTYEIPSNINEFETDGTQLDKLEDLERNINLFLVKGIYGSISNIQQQDEIYKYGKKSLGIDEDMKSLTVGLEALRQLEIEKRQKEKSKRDENMNTAVIMLSLLTTISAFVNAINIGDWYLSGGLSRISTVHIIILSIVLLLVMFFLFALLKNKFFVFIKNKFFVMKKNKRK